jgi:hypothetical protein
LNIHEQFEKEKTDIHKHIENNFESFYKAHIHVPNLIGEDQSHIYKSLPEMIE